MSFKYSVEGLEEKKEPKMIPWIGVDLDGTAAEYNGWKGWDHIGNPVNKTIERIKKWRALGIEVRILTARVSPFSLSLDENSTVEKVTNVIQNWTEKHIGERLPVTPYKDAAMLFFLDDSCVQIKENTGDPVGGDAAFQIFEDRIKEAVDKLTKDNPEDIK